MLVAYQLLVDCLKEKRFEPKPHILDSEISREFKQAIKDNDMTYQLVPPYDHRQNTAEKAIRGFALLCGAEDKFPMWLWCRIRQNTS